MKIAKAPALPPPHSLPLKFLGRSPAPIKSKSAPTTLVISIFHTSTLGVMYACYSSVQFYLICPLPSATVWKEQSSLSNSISNKIKKARKSWKRKLATAINMNLTARFFWFTHQMWGRGICSLMQLQKLWPWLQESCQSQEQVLRQPHVSTGCQLHAARHTIK